MTDAETLEGLAERVEGFKLPARCLDAMIHTEITGESCHGISTSRLAQSPEGRQIITDGWEVLKDGEIHALPRYTTSLDAAMTLVPEGSDWLRKDFRTMTVALHADDLKMWAMHYDVTAATPRARPHRRRITCPRLSPPGRGP